MSERVDKAEALFREGYNCAQAVFAAVHEELDMDQEMALKIASSFGGGMGRLREVCGAVSGLFMAAGMKYGYSETDNPELKKHHYQLIQDLARRFKEENGSIICRELLQLGEKNSDPTPEARTAGYYQRRPCVEYVRFAASLLDELDKR